VLINTVQGDLPGGLGRSVQPFRKPQKSRIDILVWPQEAHAARKITAVVEQIPEFFV
jgi:hypothetical protein